MNHSHVEVAKGKWKRYAESGYCMTKNSKGTWNLPNSVSPDKAFVVDGVTLYNNGQPINSGSKMNWIKSDKIPGATAQKATTAKTTTTTKVTVPAQKNAVYRLFNKATGEHFYTTDRNEAQKCVDNGRVYEGIAWIQADSGEDVYRLFNPNSNLHVYTVNKTELNNLVKAGWKNEGARIKGAAKNNKPVYRLYNVKNGDHLYTTSIKERDTAKKGDYKDEGVAFYGA